MILIAVAVLLFFAGITFQVLWLYFEQPWWIAPMVLSMTLALWLGTLGIIQTFPG